MQEYVMYVNVKIVFLSERGTKNIKLMQNPYFNYNDINFSCRNLST